MPPLLSYAEVSAVLYRADDIGVRLKKEQQSLAIQAVALFNSASLWSDYADYSDEIDALVSATEYQLQIPESYPPQMIQIDLFAANATLSSGAANYNQAAGVPFGYTIISDNVASVQMTNDCYLRAGSYIYQGWYCTSTNQGNTNLLILDAGGSVHYTISGSPINQNGTFGVRVFYTNAFFISSDGVYKMCVRNASAVSGNNRIGWTSHHIRQYA